MKKNKKEARQFNWWTKATAVLSVVALLVTMFVMSGCSGEKAECDDNTTTAEPTSYCATEEVDGTLVKCEYNVSEDQYTLSLDNNEYPLLVDVVDEYAYITFASNNNHALESGVVSQSAVAVGLSAPYWAPAVIAAAKTLIVKVVCITATVVGAYISADAIGTTIQQVKSNTITKSKAKSAVSEWTLVKNAARVSGSRYYYYEAKLYKNQILIGKNITHQAAVGRLKKGYDVVASGYNAAKLAAGAAATRVGTTYHHNAHGTGENFLKHFHPYGRKWCQNKSHMPHCWYLS